MTASSRLWRRAPLWRLTLAAAGSFGVLTSLYPAPSLHVPHWLPAALRPNPPGATAQKQGSVIGANTPIEQTITGTVRVAGRTMPLPTGAWHELEAARAEEQAELSWVVLGRWEGGALTGLLSVLATTGPADGPGTAHVAPACTSYGNFTVRWSDNGQTCWLVRGLTPPAPNAATPGKRTVLDLAFGRLHVLGITVPATLSTTLWSHVSGSEILNYELMVASSHGRADGPAALAAMQNWMVRFAPLLRRGFDGKSQGSAGDLLGPRVPNPFTKGF